jgi:L-phenylalanine/L-methionine N-acetyltransferase
VSDVSGVGDAGAVTGGDDITRRAQALGVSLRRAREGDAEAFAAMMNDESVYPQTLQLPYADAPFWRERLKDSGHSLTTLTHLVADREGTAIASVGLFPSMPNVRRRHAMSLGITVAHDWQGKGLGDLLMTAIVQYADRWLGLLRIELYVNTDNERAIALYRRHGFDVEGTHRGYSLRDGVYIDVHAMARLNPCMASLVARAPAAP